MENIKQEVEKLAERIETLEEQKGELKSRNQKLEQKVKQLKATVQKEHQPEPDNFREEKISRRNFMKKIGIGAAGLGVLTTFPASAFNVKSSNGFEVYGGTNTQYFNVNSGGPVEVMNTNLRLPTGKSIEDSSSYKRIEFLDAGTELLDDDSRSAISLFTGGRKIRAESNAPITFEDNEGSFTALKYSTSSSSPGTLKISNSYIEVPTAQYMLDKDSNDVSSRIYFENSSYGSNGYIQMKDGEITADDSSGNRTILT